ncbi:MAG: hypothetical protein ABI193_13410, partial [Minicystis sp.]
QWRKEWQAEDEARRAVASDRALETLNAKLELMRERALAEKAVMLEWEGDATEAENGEDQ